MITQIPFGRTGHSSSRVLLGGAAFCVAQQRDVDATLELALSFGVNHIDTAASYGDSEARVGDWIKRHGTSFFLATKTTERTSKKAKEELHRSLERLHVDHVDLLQLHHLVDPAEWEVALGPGGALKAAKELRRQGLVRFIGVTGHGLTAARMHRQSLERHEFDSVLLPFSYILAQSPQYLKDFRDLVSVCRTRNVAVQIIKSLARAPWGDRPRRFTTWYEPFEEQADIDFAIHWILGHPDLFINSVGDTSLMPKVFDAANRFTTIPADDQMREQLRRLQVAPLFV